MTIMKERMHSGFHLIEVQKQADFVMWIEVRVASTSPGYLLEKDDINIL